VLPPRRSNQLPEVCEHSPRASSAGPQPPGGCDVPKNEGGPEAPVKCHHNLCYATQPPQRPRTKPSLPRKVTPKIRQESPHIPQFP
jgi:hypothetical protein